MLCGAMPVGRIRFQLINDTDVSPTSSDEMA